MRTTGLAPTGKRARLRPAPPLVLWRGAQEWGLARERMDRHRTILGRHHSHDTPVVLYGVDRRRHFYLLGKTGTGKSTLLFNLIIQDLLAGHGVGLIDPHGSLCEAVLDEF